MSNYIPKKGDLIIITFDPQSGHEQKGRRPALVVSNSVFNQHTGFAIRPVGKQKQGTETALLFYPF
jgi:mRNA interferase MazF